MIVSWLWRVFLKLYPREHREQFGAEMRAVFEEASNERREWLERMHFCLREIAGLMWGAMKEHFRRDPPAPHDPSPAVKLRTQIETNLRRMEHAIANHQFDRARFYSYYDLKLRDKLQGITDDRDRAA